MICFIFFIGCMAMDLPHMAKGGEHAGKTMVDIEDTIVRLQKHLRALTVEIGERSVRFPENIQKTREYIEAFYRRTGLPVRTETYAYRRFEVANVISEVSFGGRPSKRYLVGAHYDSVRGTVGADDNAGAIAVQLETARNLKAVHDGHHQQPDIEVVFVSFPLEEPPVYGTRAMGSSVYARRAKKKKERIDGMICLEMVGYTCRQPGCQDYPFPLTLFGYPDKGDFIGLVGNLSSRTLNRSLYSAFLLNDDLPVIKLTVPLGGWLMPSVRLSDHACFWDQGFKAVMITDSAFFRNPHYHRPSDTMDKLDYAFMAQLVKSLMIFFHSHVSGDP